MYSTMRRLLFKIIVTVLLGYFLIGQSLQEDIRALPDCNSEAPGLSSVVLVSTIEGYLYALDGHNGGSILWSVSTGPGPMLSSSIHNLELARDGHFLRMIPSLSGGLYQFNGENVEVIPFTADDLLQSSFRFKDDLVLTGGKESRTYGIDAKTGSLLYECSMQGCENSVTNSSAVEEVLVLKRLTHTVRAVEPRTSYERWNFSVARHNVKLIPDPAALCHGNKQLTSANFDVRVIVPDGLVCGISISDPKNIMWQHKFDSPVVSAWTVYKGELREVDLFSGLQWNHNRNHNHEKSVPFSPSLYVGMHRKQLYIQESVQMLQHLGNTVNRQNLIADESVYSSIPWRPVPAIPSNTLGLPGHSGDTKVLQLTDESDQAVRTTAMSVLYASEYVNGNGFFLFSLETLKKARQAQCGLFEGVDKEEADKQTLEDLVPNQIPPPYVKLTTKPQADNGDETEYIITSLWYWWKEVLLISIGTAVLVNLMLPQVRLPRPLEPKTEEGKVLPFIHPPGTEIPPVEVAEEERPATPVHYSSRYLQEFQPVQCLGQGGFGVVFEARKKFDDCLYAVKRIPLTNKKESRERVLREVRALAKLDHNNIVRYFNSWLECPPPGWQQEQDKQWASIFPGSSCSGTTENKTNNLERSIANISLKREEKRDLGFSNIDYSTPLPHPYNVEFSRTGNRGSDSFIVFDASSSLPKQESDSENIRVEGNNTDGLDKRKDSVILVGSSSTSSSDQHLPVKNQRKYQKQSNVDKSIHEKNNIPVSYLFIQMQLCRKDSLKDWLQSTPKRDYVTVINFFEQIVMAVEYVHLNNLIHRDLKPSNIFFSMDGNIKIGDFGLVTTMLEDTQEQRTPLDSSKDSGSFSLHHTAQVGTALYMSPEQRKGEPYNYKVDIYSVGLILFELLVPFNTEMERVQVMQSLHKKTFPRDFPNKYQNEYELLKMMLDHCPDKRPTTFGIRARPPLRNRQPDEMLSDLSEEHHFDLRTRLRSTAPIRTQSSSSSSSSEVNLLASQPS